MNQDLPEIIMVDGLFAINRYTVKRQPAYSRASDDNDGYQEIIPCNIFGTYLLIEYKKYSWISDPFDNKQLVIDEVPKVTPLKLIDVLYEIDTGKWLRTIFENQIQKKSIYKVWVKQKEILLERYIICDSIKDITKKFSGSHIQSIEFIANGVILDDIK